MHCGIKCVGMYACDMYTSKFPDSASINIHRLPFLRTVRFRD